MVWTTEKTEGEIKKEKKEQFKEGKGLLIWTLKAAKRSGVVRIEAEDWRKISRVYPQLIEKGIIQEDEVKKFGVRICKIIMYKDSLYTNEYRLNNARTFICHGSTKKKNKKR